MWTTQDRCLSENIRSSMEEYTTKHGNAFSRISSGLLVAGLFLVMNSFPASADENVSVHGTAVAELSAGWWQWQEAFYRDSNFGEG
jgi:hypothetical protein